MQDSMRHVRLAGLATPPVENDEKAKQLGGAVRLIVV